MKISRHKIAALLAKRSMEPNADTKQLSQRIAAFLLETGRTGELSSLTRDIMQKRTDQGVVEVSVVSARGLAPTLKRDIKSKIRSFYPDAKRIIIDELIDPHMIGGVRLELANQQLDLTVRSKLNRFKQLTTTERD